MTNNFLTPEEEEKLKKLHGKHCQGIDVMLIEPSFKETIDNSIWDMLKRGGI